MIESPVVKSLLKLLLFLPLAAVALAVPYLWVHIDPENSYGFLSALPHGFFWGQNLALGLIDGRLAQAAQHSGWTYHVGFAAGIILAVAVWYFVNGYLQGVYMLIDEA